MNNLRVFFNNDKVEPGCGLRCLSALGRGHHHTCGLDCPEASLNADKPSLQASQPPSFSVRGQEPPDYWGLQESFSGPRMTEPLELILKRFCQAWILLLGEKWRQHII